MTQATRTVLRCTHQSPLGQLIHQLNPNGFEANSKSANNRWIEVAFDQNEYADIDSVIDDDVPAITYHAWRDPLGGELWIPAAWCEEVSHAS
ncbi:MAG: hypothetical protein AAFX78_03370 [Cyanobacteria bacterium J06638_20]